MGGLMYFEIDKSMIGESPEVSSADEI